MHRMISWCIGNEQLSQGKVNRGLVMHWHSPDKRRLSLEAYCGVEVKFSPVLFGEGSAMWSLVLYWQCNVSYCNGEAKLRSAL